ncbi:uncharacterized protein BT62DRAFT_1011374 [Guyanagaster necrorhizus]|uniref:Uncharacterized protein n=1 Tax=Guyanagaster necrorhizus TaxID=856835 RepID=A0A9P7VJ57_9AGAR|nr:uncharacterized protein BT62DRAFT_1011374 [Guyanagaster necrorhizus MCA 3950]KAG7441572.1 hypothetical protein BT62DRAFT_1011374 [Guyanagaster necrorhizus MCA 3950]
MMQSVNIRSVRPASRDPATTAAEMNLSNLKYTCMNDGIGVYDLSASVPPFPSANTETPLTSSDVKKQARAWLSGAQTLEILGARPDYNHSARAARKFGLTGEGAASSRQSSETDKESRGLAASDRLVDRFDSQICKIRTHILLPFGDPKYANLMGFLDVSSIDSFISFGVYARILRDISTYVNSLEILDVLSKFTIIGLTPLQNKQLANPLKRSASALIQAEHANCQQKTTCVFFKQFLAGSEHGGETVLRGVRTLYAKESIEDESEELNHDKCSGSLQNDGCGGSQEIYFIQLRAQVYPTLISPRSIAIGKSQILRSTLLRGTDAPPSTNVAHAAGGPEIDERRDRRF